MIATLPLLILLIMPLGSAASPQLAKPMAPSQPQVAPPPSWYVYSQGGEQLSGNHIQMTSATDGWLVSGEQHRLYRYNGTTWTSTDQSAVQTFAFTSTNQGWLVRTDLTGISFLNYNGSSWQVSDVFTNTGPNGATYSVSSMQLFANGGAALGLITSTQLSSPVLFRLLNGHWSASTSGSTRLNSATVDAYSFLNANEGWAILDGFVFHFVGSDRTQISNPCGSTEPCSLTSIAMIGPNDVWVGGVHGLGQPFNFRGLAHWVSGTWQLYDLDSGGIGTHEVPVLTFYSPTMGLMTRVLQGRTPVTYRWDGSTWAGIPSGLLPEGVGPWYFTSPTEAWQATQTGGALHYLDGTLSMVMLPGSVVSLSFVSPTEGWAIGTSLLHYYAPCSDSYSDVPSTYWAYQYIHDLSCRGVLAGTGSGNFSPNAATTRVQFAKMISLARGWVLLNPATPSFNDVPASNPLYTYVETAAANAAITGYQDGSFRPNLSISRAQTALILVRAYGWPTNTAGGPHFSDVPSGHFAYAAVETAYNRGIINGLSATTFAPNASVTRAQISKMLYLGIQQPTVPTTTPTVSASSTVTATTTLISTATVSATATLTATAALTPTVTQR